MNRLLSITAMAAGLSACGDAGTEAPVSSSWDGPVTDVVTVVYQSRLDGEIEPCG